MVGPWQVPVADCATTLLSFDGYAGEAFAIGERTPLAVIDAPASGRMAVAEALTNLAAAPVRALSLVKLSANWMAAAGAPGEDAALFDTVRAVALDLCPALGVSIPVGKDSMSMRTTWEERGARAEVVSPVSLIVSAFAPCDDVRETWTPQLRTDAGPTALVLVDLVERPGAARRVRSWRRSTTRPATRRRTSTTRRPSAGSSTRSPELRAAGLVLAYHDRSDGGLFVTLCEMAFAGHAGVDGRLPARSGTDGDGARLAALFAEELGAVIQVRDADVERGAGRAGARTASPRASSAARVADDDQIRVRRGSAVLFSDVAHRASPRLERDDLADPVAARQPRLRAGGIRPHPRRRRSRASRPLVTFDPAEDVAAPFIARGARPPIAILREQGVNGEVEMAAAFDRAGFEAHDVHMSDIIEGRVSLASFRGLRGLRRASRTATCSAAARAGRSRSSTTRARATSSRRSSRGPTPSPSASATAAR